MSGQRMVAAAVLEKVREFDRVATLLDMPRPERLSVLNVTEPVYAALLGGTAPERMVRPELERRLSYALPLMRRLASNSPVLKSPSSGSIEAA